jgi:hypothetical protein
VDYRGIRELRAGFVFEGEHPAPVDAVAGYRDSQSPRPFQQFLP